MLAARIAYDTPIWSTFTMKWAREKCEWRSHGWHEALICTFHKIRHARMCVREWMSVWRAHTARPRTRQLMARMVRAFKCIYHFIGHILLHCFCFVQCFFRSLLFIILFRCFTAFLVSHTHHGHRATKNGDQWPLIESVRLFNSAHGCQMSGKLFLRRFICRFFYTFILHSFVADALPFIFYWTAKDQVRKCIRIFSFIAADRRHPYLINLSSLSLDVHRHRRRLLWSHENCTLICHKHWDDGVAPSHAITSKGNESRNATPTTKSTQ